MELTHENGELRPMMVVIKFLDCHQNKLASLPVSDLLRSLSCQARPEGRRALDSSLVYLASRALLHTTVLS